ncbi:hypothetical protein BJ165DRAFT_1534116 [Panaeolus papilionaceus]|nr:hypothetical protein BJ165DRAFT_1534116 [Panaeolus papilionaceus]
MSFFKRGKSTNTKNDERRDHNQQNTVPFSSSQTGTSQQHEANSQQRAQQQYYPGYVQVPHHHHNPHQQASTQQQSRVRRVSFAQHPPSQAGYVRQRHASQGYPSHAHWSNLRHFLAAERAAHSSDSRSTVAEPSRSPRGSMTSMSSDITSARHRAARRQLRAHEQERGYGRHQGPPPPPPPPPPPQQQQQQHAIPFHDLNREQQEMVRAQLRQVPIPHGFNGVDMLLGRRLPPGSGMPISTANLSGVINGTGINANFHSADLRNARFGPFQ